MSMDDREAAIRERREAIRGIEPPWKRGAWLEEDRQRYMTFQNHAHDDIDHLLATCDSLRAEVKQLQQDAQSVFSLGLELAAAKAEIEIARRVAGHVEEAGEVCVADCLACNHPVEAVIRDLREVRNIAFQRGRELTTSRSSTISEAIGVAKDYAEMNCLEFERKYGITDKQGLVDALSAMKETQAEAPQDEGK